MLLNVFRYKNNIKIVFKQEFFDILFFVGDYKNPKTQMPKKYLGINKYI